MNLQDRLIEDIKQAMRDGDQSRRSILRVVRAAVHNEEIHQGKALEDEGVIQVISRLAREHVESIEMFKKGNREDLVDKEESELAILRQYLPAQLSKEEIIQLAKQIIQELGAVNTNDRGKVMGKLMPQIRGRGDGAEANNIVLELLGGAAQ